MTQQIEKIFTEIYRKSIWKSLDPQKESHSGVGSTLKATKSLRGVLPTLLEQRGIKTILDAPCGDFNWMKTVDLQDRKYIGADIVEDLVQYNQKTYTTPNRIFTQLDLLVDNLPQVDLIICRDCLVHLSFDDARLAIENIIKSNSIYLLTTTYDERKTNQKIKTGSWTPYSLEAPPFNFPKPLQLINERCKEVYPKFIDKSLGLWKICDLPRKV